MGCFVVTNGVVKSVKRLQCANSLFIRLLHSTMQILMNSKPFDFQILNTVILNRITIKCYENSAAIMSI